MYQSFIKRLLDIVLSLLGLAVLALPMLAVAAVIKLDSPGPVFFKQKRIGLHKSYFTILKFRSMPVTVPSDLPTDQFRGEDVLSPWQRFMRSTSVDELPQLFNILAGQMSVVGPRPALWNQDELIAERDRYGANDVRPGLTGWAQINGRDVLTDAVKARYDGEYVEKLSFVFDCRCVLGTVGKVLRREGVVEGGAGRLEGEREKETVLK